MTLTTARAVTLEGWKGARLDAVADLVSGGTPSKSRPDWWTGPIPWASPKDMKRLRLADTADHITEEAAEAGSRVVPAKTIFVVIRGMILAKALPVAIAEVPMAFNQDMKAIIPRAGVDPDYLLYALASRREALASEIGTSAHGTRRLGSSSLEALQIPLPPLNEQRAIGYFLTTLQVRVDVQAQRVAALKRAKDAMITKLFRAGLRGEPLKTTDLGKIPESWQMIRLGDVVSRVNYGTSSRCVPDGPGQAVLRIPNVVHDLIDTRDLKYAHLAPAEAVRLRLTPGDLLFVRTNGNPAFIGRCAVYEGDPPEAAFASYLIRVTIDSSRLLPEFAQTYLSAFGRDQLLAAANAASDGKYNIDTGGLRSLLLPLPDVTEQGEIVRRLRAIDQRLRMAERQLKGHRALAATMLDALLTGKLRLSPGLIGKLSLRATATAPKPHGNVDERVIEEAVRRIVEAIAPEKIILFGSAAHGEMGPDSDLDFLVIKQGMAIRDAHRAIRDRLRGIGVPIDTVVVTPNTVERYGDIIGHIVRPALREGRVVYAA